jgi:hypothetical protein
MNFCLYESFLLLFLLLLLIFLLLSLFYPLSPILPALSPTAYSEMKEFNLNLFPKVFAIVA